ncbi:amidohydrolase family protein [Kitasatospora sp. NPDC051984]|uniref:amidohydrolase family protein n=1 Tax=Kitasatospora sp. NPDC051984 TaxID=3364059 RepID=UPI0037C5FBDB
MTAARRIDAHHHLWDLSVRAQDWLDAPELTPLRRDFTIDELRPQAAAAGIGATVAVQTVCLAEETPELLALADTDPLVAGVVGWTDLTAPDVADRLAALRELPGGRRLVGIRHQVQNEPDPRWLLRPEVQRGLHAVGAAGLAYDLIVRPHQLPASVAAAAAVPGLTFVLDHLGKPPIAARRIDRWQRDVRLLAALPNTTAKISGLTTEADWRTWHADDLRPCVETALEAFGPDRLMFGSDWPVSTLAGDYRRTADAVTGLLSALAGHERDAVLGATAARVYGI